jgi:L-fuculose-phosphate aldolase
MSQTAHSDSTTREQLVRLARWMAMERLAWGSSGNISARSGDDGFLLSASGTWFERLESGDLAPCRLSDGGWDGNRKPSKEIAMHRAIYARRPDAAWVLHCTPPSATVFACQHRVPAAGVFVEGMAYVGEVAEVDYLHPGTAELGAAVGEAAARANVVLLRNHGVIVFDVSPEEARMRLLSLEFACTLELAAERSGIGLKILAPAVVDDFRARRIYRPPTA